MIETEEKKDDIENFNFRKLIIAISIRQATQQCLLCFNVI